MKVQNHKKNEKNSRERDLGVTVVDNDFAGAFLEDNTSYGAFSAASANYSLRGKSTR